MWALVLMMPRASTSGTPPSCDIDIEAACATLALYAKADAFGFAFSADGMPVAGAWERAALLCAKADVFSADCMAVAA